MEDEASLDSKMAHLADLFTGRVQGDEELEYAAWLPRAKLDDSLASLDFVMEWLEAVFSDGFDGTQDQNRSLLWAGAYLGETIRRLSPHSYRWCSWDELHADEVESVRDVIPREFTTQFLLSCPGGVTLPLRQVRDFSVYGPKYDLRLYAAAECGARG